MKKFLFLFCAVPAWYCSCDTSFTTPASETKKTDTAMDAMPTLSGTHCYAFAGIEDSIFMTVDIHDKQASGRLTYKLAGKDKNDGRFEGTMDADTLFANYYFLSERVSSRREIAFILRDDEAVEAYGEVVVDSSGVRFKDRHALSAEHSFTLAKKNCETAQ